MPVYQKKVEFYRDKYGLRKDLVDTKGKESDKPVLEEEDETSGHDITDTDQYSLLDLLQDYLQMLRWKLYKKQIQVRSAKRLYMTLRTSKGPYIERHKLTGIVNDFEVAHAKLEAYGGEEMMGGGWEGEADIWADGEEEDMGDKGRESENGDDLADELDEQEREREIR